MKLREASSGGHGFLLESATGIDFGGVEALNRIGERIFTMERLFNLKAGNGWIIQYSIWSGCYIAVIR